uniref:Uncharacterized protein n=1 Tax=Lepeophtheirus salmonis TaxID=72036 RepID=A0A0K2TA34_LEPSM
MEYCRRQGLGYISNKFVLFNFKFIGSFDPIITKTSCQKPRKNLVKSIYFVPILSGIK